MAEVYNLMTDTGMYIANNAVVSNCDALRYLLATHKRLNPQTQKLSYIGLPVAPKSDLNDVFGRPQTNPLSIRYKK